MTNPTITDADRSFAAMGFAGIPEAHIVNMVERIRAGEEDNHPEVIRAAKFREEATAELRAENESLEAEIGQHVQENALAQAEIARLREGFSAACAFIASNVADPDITDEMAQNYAAFEKARDNIEALTKAGEA